MKSDGSPGRATEPVDRAECLRVIVTEVREMVSRAEAAGLMAPVASLRVLLSHYESELARLEAPRALSAW
jgi:hypothetical protein